MTKQQTGGSAGIEPSPPGSIAIYIVLLLAPLFWGGNTIAGKLAVGHVDPATLTLCRFIGAVLVTLPIAWPHIRRDWPVVRDKIWLLLLLGGVGYAVFNLLLYPAPYYTSVVNVSMEQAAIPVLVMLGNFIIFGVRAGPLQIIGVILTILGVAVVATHGDLTRILSLEVNQGDALVVAAAVVYAGYSLALRYKPDTHWLTFLGFTLMGALLVSVLNQLLFAGGPILFAERVSEVTTQGWLVIAFTATFPAILAQLAFAVSVVRVGPNRASLFINLIPVFGTLMSVLFLGEVMQGFHYTAWVLIIIGIVMAEWTARQRTAPRAGISSR
jgi:drug/metabolite transporter (DMT)-like permease